MILHKLKINGWVATVFYIAHTHLRLSNISVHATLYFMMVALPTRTHTPFLPKMKFRDHFLYNKAVTQSGMFIISSWKVSKMCGPMCVVCNQPKNVCGHAHHKHVLELFFTHKHICNYTWHMYHNSPFSQNNEYHTQAFKNRQLMVFQRTFSNLGFCIQ